MKQLPKKYKALLSIKRPVLIECNDRFRILHPSGLSLYLDTLSLRSHYSEDDILKSNEEDWFDSILSLSCFCHDVIINDNLDKRVYLNKPRSNKLLTNTVESMYSFDKRMNISIIGVIGA